MFNNGLAEIISIEGRILSVKPVGMLGGVKPPVIHDVPLGLLGNATAHTDHALKIGDIVPIFFTTMDISNYVSFGSTDTVGEVNLNSYNSCFALPITFNIADFGLSLPSSISQVGDNIHKGNLDQTGTQIVSGLCESKVDYIGGGVSLANHIHKNTKPGNDTEFSGPPKK